MKKVITYGTFDLLHQGHINLLKRAKALGDYLIVGITTKNFDIERGKISVQQNLMERIKAVEETGLADEIIIEEYPGQKIDDIKKYHIDIFAIGSDWEGKFDYLKEFCDVVYLERTKGISSTQLREEKNKIKIGIYSNSPVTYKVIKEIRYVNGLSLSAIYTDDKILYQENEYRQYIVKDFKELLEQSDVIYIDINPFEKYKFIEEAITNKKSVITESPICLSKKQILYLFDLSRKNQVLLFDSIKTGYMIGFNRLISLVKSGEIGDIRDISVSCTSLNPKSAWLLEANKGGSMLAWGAYTLLPIFQLYGSKVEDIKISSIWDNNHIDVLSKINFTYEKSLATAKVGIGVKSEGDLIISGTKGYVYVPSPWWKTEYFELRYEDFNKNRRFFYKLEGEGIRLSLSTFVKTIQEEEVLNNIPQDFSIYVCEIFEQFMRSK